MSSIYTLRPIKRESLKDFPWQRRATNHIVEKFHVEKTKRGCLFRAGTGLGKTHVTIEALVEMLLDGSFLKVPNGSFNPFPVLWLGPKNSLIEVERKLEIYGCRHLVTLMSYSQLSYTAGKECSNMFIQFVSTVDVNGEPCLRPVWNPSMLPAIVVCDETQKLRNEASTRTRVLRALPSCVKVIHVSATPYQRVQDSRCLLETMGVVTRFNALPATNETSPWIMREIASPKHPSEFSPSACGRLREELLPWMVEIKGVKFPFPATSECVETDFDTPADRNRYNLAVQEWLEELARARKEAPRSQWGMMMASIMKFRQKCALLRAPSLALNAHYSYKNGKFPIVAENFKDALRVVFMTLVKRFNVPKDEIAFIVGGQNASERQQMVDDFQCGKRKIMLLIMGAGGESISLHHDRPATMPRDVLLPAVWSAIEMAQVLGRGHRITSISPTHQRVFWFKDTIESERVKPKVELKFKCLNKAIIAKEQFASLFMPDDKTDSEVEELFAKCLVDQEDDDETTEVEDFTGEGLGNEVEL